jgi:hypothetical protein
VEKFALWLIYATDFIPPQRRRLAWNYKNCCGFVAKRMPNTRCMPQIFFCMRADSAWWYLIFAKRDREY